MAEVITPAILFLLVFGLLLVEIQKEIIIFTFQISPLAINFVESVAVGRCKTLNVNLRRVFLLNCINENVHIFLCTLPLT